MEFEDFLDLMREGGFLEGRAPQQNSGIMAAAPRGTYTQNRKNNMMAYGGIAGSDGRKKYGIGSWFQEKIMDPIKENPVTTALLGGAAVNQFGLPDFLTESMGMGSDVGQNWLGNLLGKDLVYGPGGEQFGTTITNPQQLGDLEKAAQVISQPGSYFGEDQEDDVARMMQSMGLNTPEKLYRAVTTPGFKLTDPSTWGSAISNLLGPSEIGGQQVNWKTPLAIGTAMGAAQAAMPKDVLPTDTSGIDIPAIRAAALRGEGDFLPPASATTAYAKGGRIGAQEGGLMNLGGMEKDYRQEGGFVPIGGEEKADDVPARLSKNEFVFTADAVRAAGGGDIDAGAEVMENLMNNLERG